MISAATQLAVQAHLTEYSALREEMLELIKWRDQLVFASLATSGALFSFAFSGADTAEVPQRLALYLIPPISTAIGGIWIQNGLRVERIRAYLKDVLTPRLNALVAFEGGASPIEEVLAWESSSQRDLYAWPRRILGVFPAAMSFFLIGVVAQALLLREQHGSLWDSLRLLESPTIFLANSAILLVYATWIGVRAARHRVVLSGVFGRKRGPKRQPPTGK